MEFTKECHVIEIVDKNWLEPLFAHATRSDVGCVGARLLYPDKTVQHAVVICGMSALEVVAGHASKHLRFEDPGYFQMAVATQEFLAVSFNDVDLCLRVNGLGYRNIFCAYVELIHHESKSIGSDAQPDKIARAVSEARMMRERWATTLDTDPFYSPSFSRMSENFRLDEPGINAIAYLASEEKILRQNKVGPNRIVSSMKVNGRSKTAESFEERPFRLTNAKNNQLISYWG